MLPVTRTGELTEAIKDRIKSALGPQDAPGLLAGQCPVAIALVHLQSFFDSKGIHKDIRILAALLWLVRSKMLQAACQYLFL